MPPPFAEHPARLARERLAAAEAAPAPARFSRSSDRRVPDRLESLLEELGPQLCRGGSPDPTETRCATGLPAVDHLLGGGFPRGRLSEIAGPTSAGRTSLLLALLARTTAVGEVAGLVDAADAFDPPSAASAGVEMARVLWVRAPGTREALRSAEHLLGASGFALVLLDLGGPGYRQAVVPAGWPRLRKAVASTGTALVVLADQRLAGSFADLALEMGRPRPRFTGTPALLEGLDSEVRLVRNRLGPSVRSVPVHWPAWRARTPDAA